MAAVIVLVMTLLLSGPVMAQEASLIDILKAKGVLSQEEAQKLSNTGAAKGDYDQQALVNLLKAKGILDEKDLAQLPAPAVMAVAPPSATPPVPAPAPDLNERLARLEQEVNKKPPFVAGYEDGFFVRSADGNFSLRIGGRVALHTLYQQEDTSQNDSFFLDRVRFYVEGVLYKYFQYKIENDFTSSSGLRDAYLNVTYFPQANVQIGQYKVPFSYEALLSKRYLDLVERSAVTLSTVNPSRDIGFMVHGRVAGGLLNYQLAVLNGSGQNTADNNSAKDLAARFVLAPFISQKDSLLSGLNFGGAVTYGHEPKSKSIVGTSPTGFQFFRAVDVRGDRLRVGGHLAWFYGPYSLTGEYIYTSEERQSLGKDQVDLSDFVTQGGYIGGTWLLSGENKIFNKPNRPLLIFLDPTGKMDGWGSWELAARYETFSLDNEGGSGKPGALKRNTFEAARLGLNWYLNPWTRVSVEYLYSLFDDAKRSPRLGHHAVNSLLSRVQVEF
ncbi:MAG TPA: porin [Candidatus Binatia bacterium]|jgi:phosphate-selective porin OprO/OprP|nr:porin [Candidatus Binatia bacterium]